MKNAHLLPKMRAWVQFFLLLAWLLLVVSQLQDSHEAGIQAIDSVHSNHRPRKLTITRAERRNAVSAWVEEQVQMKRNRKTPSVPNPVGNQHPPSRQ